MHKFIEVKTANGDTAYINVDHIVAITYDKGEKVTLIQTTQDLLQVEDTVKSLMSRVR